jgi:hypothetical protein
MQCPSLVLSLTLAPRPRPPGPLVKYDSIDDSRTLVCVYPFRRRYAPNVQKVISSIVPDGDLPARISTLLKSPGL